TDSRRVTVTYEPGRRQPDSGRDLREARGEQIEGPAGSMCVARSQLAMPEVLGLALEAEQRVIRGAAPLDRVVADPRVFLMPVHDQHGGVEVEDQPSRWPRPSSHPAEKGMEPGGQFGAGGRSHAQQEAPERR